SAVNVKHPLPVSRASRRRQGAVLASLITGHPVAVGNGKAVIVAHINLAEFFPVVAVAGENAVVRGNQNGRTIETFKHAAQGGRWTAIRSNKGHGTSASSVNSLNSVNQSDIYVRPALRRQSKNLTPFP